VRISDRLGRTFLIVAMAVSWAIVGCQKVNTPAVPPTTTSAPQAVLEPADEQAEPPEQAASAPAADTATGDEEITGVVEPPVGVAEPLALDLVAIAIELPSPAFRGTPVPLKEAHVEKPLGKPRPPFLAPKGTVNLALAKPVSASDPAPPSGEVDYVTDGDKEASDFGYLELRSGAEWVQVDLGQKATIYAVLLWHSHAEARVYRDVVVLVSDDIDFLDAQTVFNSDYDNTSGLGIGADLGYVETAEGKLIDCKGVEGRYVRLYSNGSHIDEKNHYTEVEVFGRPTG